MLSRFQAAYATHLVSSIDQCSESAGFINDVSSFPAIAILSPEQTLLYRGAGERIYTITCVVRGYVRSTEETSIADSELLARQIEEATALFPRGFASAIIIQSGLVLTEALDMLVTEQIIAIARENKLDYVEAARVLTVSTDEGLMSPYGICDVGVEMIYVKPSD